MTNFEKFVNTFGFTPHIGYCITDDPCRLCPAYVDGICCTKDHIKNWWHGEYKEEENE